MNLPSFLSAQRQYEAMLPPEDVDECGDYECGECETCLADRAEAEAEDYAEMQREEQRLESRYGRD